jgi:cysteine-rich CPXCG protein
MGREYIRGLAPRGAGEEYVEDCPVCCQPWTVYVSYTPDGAAEVSLAPEDES